MQACVLDRLGTGAVPAARLSAVTLPRPATADEPRGVQFLVGVADADAPQLCVIGSHGHGNVGFLYCGILP